MRCEDVCVTDFDCVSVTGAQHQSTVTNFSCHYIEPAETLTCRWRPRHVAGATSSSLIFRPKKGFRHCSYIFNLSGLFNVTLKTKNLETNNETLSEPHMVDMHLSVKAPRPNVTLIKASETMLNITWSNGQWGAEMWETKYCKIRRRSVNKDQWMETPTLVPVKRGDEMMYAMDGLKPFTRYMLAVSCIGHYGHWSDWSLVAAGMTQESVPAKPPHVSYSIRASGSEGTQHLLLIWAPLHPRYSNGKVLGYNVTFYPPKYLGLKRTVTVTGLKISLEVLMERYEVAVSAYNSAGESPRRRLTVDAGHHRTLAPVRGLWVHSKDGVLWLQWDVPPQPASELAIEWRPTDSTHSLWWRVNSSIATPVALPDRHDEPQHAFNEKKTGSQGCVASFCSGKLTLLRERIWIASRMWRLHGVLCFRRDPAPAGLHHQCVSCSRRAVWTRQLHRSRPAVRKPRRCRWPGGCHGDEAWSNRSVGVAEEDPAHQHPQIQGGAAGWRKCSGVNSTVSRYAQILIFQTYGKQQIYCPRLH
uniref:Fibronectin type-III domain-containing protein n=1 Tax=Denticeps clupeoides TaxID=299321 RepID=A0AAY4CNQ2_9TELE